MALEHRSHVTVLRNVSEPPSRIFLSPFLELFAKFFGRENFATYDTLSWTGLCKMAKSAVANGLVTGRPFPWLMVRVDFRRLFIRVVTSGIGRPSLPTSLD